MSEPLRVAAAVEGPTDVIVLQAILRALLPDDTELVFQRCSRKDPPRSALHRSAVQVEDGPGSIVGAANPPVRAAARSPVLRRFRITTCWSCMWTRTWRATPTPAAAFKMRRTKTCPARSLARRRRTPPTPCERWFSTGLESMNVRRGPSCACLRRAPKPGCLRRCGLRTTWFDGAIGSAVPTRRASLQPCPKADDSRNIKTTIDASPAG